MPVRVSIVIPVFNKVELTLPCLLSLTETTDEQSYEVIVVDNASTDGTPELLASLEGDVTILRNETNLGFGEACNQGAAVARGEYVLFLNNDTVLLPGWLPPLVAALNEDPRLAAVQPRLIYPDGRLNDAGGLMFANGEAWVYGKRATDPQAPQYSTRRVPDYASGACLLVRRTAFEQVNGFDSRYAPAYYEDTDLSFALRAAGWTVLYEPASTVVHVEGGTAGTDVTQGLKAYQVRNKERFAQKWAGELACRPRLDPAIIESWAHRGQRGDGPGEIISAEGPAATAVRSVLVVDLAVPAPDRASGSLRLFQLMRCLREQGHAVACYVTGDAYDRERYAAQLSTLGVTLYGLDPAAPTTADPERALAYRPYLEQVIADRAPDLVLAGPWMAAELVLPVVRRVAPRTTVVVDTCDLHFVREEREAALSGDNLPDGLRERRERELAVYRAADRVVCVTDAEAELLNRVLPDVRISVVGNAHDRVDTGPHFADRKGFLFVGNANHTPNVDAVAWWRAEIAPRLSQRLPGVGLTVVGNDPAGRLRALQGEGVDVVGWVPDTLPYLHSARVSVAPLRYGAGMKGKVGEALMAGLPLVGTSVATEGMAIRDNAHALVADDPDSLVAALVRLHEDEGLWSSLREAGRAHIECLAGVDVMRQQVSDLLRLLPDVDTASDGLSRHERRASQRRSRRKGGSAQPVPGHQRSPGGSSAMRPADSRHPRAPEAFPVADDATPSGGREPGPLLNGNLPACTLVITATDDLPRLRTCLETLIDSTPAHLYEVVLVFRCDTPALRRFSARLEGSVTSLWNASDPGRAAARDQGADSARTDVIVFLDDSVCVEPGWLPPLLASFETPEVGLTAPRLRMPDKSLQVSPESMEFAVAVRRDLLQQVGGFVRDVPTDFPDLCQRLERAGHSTALHTTSVVTPTSQLAAPTQQRDGAARRSVHVHPLTELRNKHNGEDIWVIASGASLTSVKPSFFANKVTIGLNQVYRKYDVDYVVRKEHAGAQAVIDSGARLVVSTLDCGNQSGPPELTGHWWQYDHPMNRVERSPDLSAVGSPDRLTVSWSTITTAMHLAAYMGAANVMVCGHDAGILDGRINYPGYYDGVEPEILDRLDTEWYVNWLTKIEAQSVTVRDALVANYGCSIHALNPFLTLNLEGHLFTGTRTAPRPRTAERPDTAHQGRRG